MNTNLQGNIGESKVLTHLLKEGYNVYLPFGTASKNDMVVEKDNKVERVSVKTATRKIPSGKYRVKIRQGKMNKETPFDNTGSDLLCVYIVPEDRIVVLKSSDIKNKSELFVE